MLLSASRKTVLALVQLPPPEHGAATVNQDVVHSDLLNEAFRIVTVPIQLSRSRNDIGILGPRKVLALIINAARTTRALLLEKPDFVYIALPPVGGGFYADLPLVALAKSFNQAILYHFHGKGVRKAAESSLYRRLFKWAMRDAKVILLSERLYDDIAEFVPISSVCVVPNALARSVGLASAPQRDGRHILFLSNLIVTKGPLVLLDALALLKKRHVDFRATIAGAPTIAISTEALEQEIASRGLARHVQYVGPVSGQAKWELLASASILALPTFNDAFPLVVLEAMGCGVAVVATPEGAIPDLIRDGESGYLVPYHDVDALADVLQRLVDDPELCQKIAQRGHESVARNYSYDQFHTRMKDVWLSIANEHGRAGGKV